MKTIGMLVVVMVLACLSGCGASREEEFKDALTKMKIEGSDFDMAVEQFRKFGVDEQKKALESAKKTVLESFKISATSDLKIIQTAAENYLLKADHVLKSVSDLVGPNNYLKELPRDPWGNEYRLNVVNRDTFEIICAGPDGKFGTSDDICLK